MLGTLFSGFSKILQQATLAIFVPIPEHDDQIAWLENSSGMFSVKDAMKTFRPEVPLYIEVV